MGSTFGGLNTLVRGLYANQVSLNTVGHNISNANTEGFSRQEVNLVTTVPQKVYGSSGSYQLGTGVDIQSITRSRDVFVDRQMWQESSSLGYGEATYDLLSRVEGVFAEPTDTGIQTVLNKFWTSWQNLSTNASNESVRTAVRQRGVELVDAIQHSAQQLKDMVKDINSTLEIKVDQVNQITSEIASINKQVTLVEVGGKDHANDLRDRRDYLTDQLSKLMKINVYEDKDGNYNINSGNLTLVSVAESVTLDTTMDKGSSTFTYYGIEVNKIIVAENSALGTRGKDANFIGGEITGLLEARDSTDTGVRAYLDQVDTISQFLLKDFNEVHKAGYGTDDSTGTLFFGEQANAANYADPTWKPANYKGGWIEQLTVNSDLFNTADGLQKIAAKTQPGTLEVTQNHVAAGKLSVNGSYTGPGNQTYIVRTDTTDASGNVLTASYSVDGGSTWTAATKDTTVTTPPYTFKLNNGVTVNIATLAVNAGTTPGPADTYTFMPTQGNASGDNAILMGNRLKTDKRDSLGKATLDSYYNALTGTLGVQVQNAERLIDNQTTLITQITNWRESTAGVNMDEEMSDMIRFQKGYSAASRVVTAIDEMLDKLINGTGVVGR
ncbi:MAG: flagellar hook-associated protein FlgK [Anaerosporomusa subterranea]|jgi:flagellar hook-associated protein 1 FlgK|nr:flagellar hook-associated protein FlgK [Anaerosporomusa subterranea]